MGLMKISSGRDIPREINAIIEIPMHSEPVKYEVDKESGVLFVDRFLTTPMFYPVNYGYMPHTLSEDGDPVDVLVVAPLPLISGSVIPCRPIGMLKMTDESGEDAKILAVPIDKLSKIYQSIQSFEDMPQHIIKSIEHFFSHYKDLEEGKWVQLNGWAGPEAAFEEIIASVARLEKKDKK